MADLSGQRMGRYRLDELVGRGGMAEVYAAHDEVLDRRVAVKLILPAFAADEQFFERFLREARLVAALDHPNILTVFDFGDSDGRAFLVMPFLSGGTLVDRLRRGPQPLLQAVGWIGQLAAALDAAHQGGILHRDVKPGNALFSQGDRLVLSDFGIARACESSTHLTATGVVVGTPAYMAPELARGAPASPASDRYSLAVVAYETLSGSVPFDGENALSILHQQVNEPVPPLGSRVSGLPDGLEELFQRALAKEPGERPPSCASLAEEMLSFLGEEELATLAAERQLWPTPTGGLGVATRPVRSRGGVSTRPSQDAIPTLVEPPAGAVGTPAGTVSSPIAARSTAGRWLAAVAVVALGLVVWRGATRLAVQPSAEGIGPTDAATDGTSLGRSLVPNGPRRTEPVQPVPPADEPAVSVGASEASVEPPPVATDQTDVRGDRSVAGSGPADRPLTAVLGTGAQRRQLEQLRRPPRALTARDFEAISATAQQVGEPLGGELARLLGSYGHGGQAYARGDDAAARRHLEALRHGSEDRVLELAWLLPLLRGAAEAGDPWELAVAFADARGEGLRMVEQVLDEHPGNRRAALARAYLLHLAGRHGDAATAAERLVGGLEVEDDDGVLVAAQFLVLEHIEVGDESAARRWLGELAKRREDPRAVALIFEAARYAALVGKNPIAERRILEEACNAGVALACGRGKPLRPGRRRGPARP